jgi:phosphoglycolate phosphatase
MSGTPLRIAPSLLAADFARLGEEVAALVAAGPIEAIAFDLDGTLVDSAPDIAPALNAALLGAQLQRFDASTVRTWVGDGPDALILRALAAQGLGHAPAELRARLRRGFDAHTLAAPLAHGQVYEGVADLLAGLHKHYPMAVVTNKPSHLAHAVLEAAGLSAFMVSVHGADSAELRKPAPALLLAAAQRLAVPCERLLMVGDGPADMVAAQNARCPAALVAWGYGAETVPAEVHAWRVAEPRHLLQGLTRGRKTVLSD